MPDTDPLADALLQADAAANAAFGRGELSADATALAQLYLATWVRWYTVVCAIQGEDIVLAVIHDSIAGMVHLLEGVRRAQRLGD